MTVELCPIVSMSHRDQASHLRKLVAGGDARRASDREPAGSTAPDAGAAADKRAPRARAIAVTSGKGGVGKTNLAVNLAIAAAKQHGLKTLVLDVDLGLANVGVVLDVTASKNLAHVVTGEAGVLDTVVRTPYGIDIVPGASGIGRIADLGDAERLRLLAELQRLERSYDAIFIDTGAGISRNVIHFAVAADDIVVVATPEPTSNLDSYATIKRILQEERGRRLHLVVNMAESQEEGARTAEKIASVAARFLDVKVPCAGIVVQDRKVALAVKRRRPFLIEYPESAAASSVLAIAKRLFENAPAHVQGDGFMRRWLRALDGEA